MRLEADLTEIWWTSPVEKRYREADGQQQGVLELVLQVIEPIPAIDTFEESDWRVRREMVDGEAAVRVAAGPENAAGELERDRARGFWFDDGGRLIRVVTQGVDVRRSDFETIEGAQDARTTLVHAPNGGVAMKIAVVSLETLSTEPAKSAFVVKGSEWKRQFTDQVR